MYEVYYLERDDWGKLHYYKRRGLVKNLGRAIKLCKAYGKNAYVKRYGSRRPIWVNNPNINKHLEKI